MSLRFALLLSFLGGLTACGLSPCEESVLPTCDPREADCQRELHAHVACVRGGDDSSEPPSFEFVTADEFHGRYDALPSPPEDLQTCLAITSLWPTPGMHEAVDPTARFDPELQSIVVVDSAEPEALQIPVLRALAQAQRDDELGGFSAWRAEHGKTLDQAAALDALFEGEAWLAADAAALKTSAQADEDFRNLVADELDDYENAESELFRYAGSRGYDYRYVDRRFAVAGARFALKYFIAANHAAIDEAFERPVTSTAELIRRRLTDAAPAEPNTPYDLPAGYGARVPQRLGAARWFDFLMRVDPIEASNSPFDPTNEDFEQNQRYADVAGRWTGDRFDCALDGQGNPLVVWEFAFDPGVELELFEMTRTAPGTWRWIESEDEDYLILVGSYDEDAVMEVIASLESQ